MKKVLSGCLLPAVIAFFLSAYGANAYAASQPTRIDVLYMNHGPLMDTLDRMKKLFAGYGDKISVSWVDFESREGEDFKAKKGIHQHVPLVIWIDGNEVVNLGERQVTFAGFPTGAGPAFFQGKWTMDDLKAAVDQSTAER
jgi:hypothetical protein